MERNLAISEFITCLLSNDCISQSKQGQKKIVRACVYVCVECACLNSSTTFPIYSFSLLSLYSFTFNSPSPTDKRKKIFLKFPSKIVHETFARALNGIYLLCLAKDFTHYIYSQLTHTHLLIKVVM